jgi:hypothetical protein
MEIIFGIVILFLFLRARGQGITLSGAFSANQLGAPGAPAASGEIPYGGAAGIIDMGAGPAAGGYGGGAIPLASIPGLGNSSSGTSSGSSTVSSFIPNTKGGLGNPRGLPSGGFGFRF